MELISNLIKLLIEISSKNEIEDMNMDCNSFIYSIAEKIVKS